MAEMIKFYKGAVANLPSTGVNGALYITTDEGAIYLGTGTGMKRLGDFIQVDAVANLPVDGANASALYYCVAENILAKWNGSGWTQINKQRTADEIKTLIGLADYETKADASAKLDTAKKYADDEVKKVSDYVGTLPDGTTATSVVDYVNVKTAGIATDAALAELQGQVTAAQQAIDVIEEDYLKAADKTELQGKIDEKAAQNDLDSATDRITALENANKEGGAVATQIAAAQTAADNAQSTADQAQAAADAAQGEVDSLEAKVGEVTEGKTVVGLITDAQTAADEAQADVDALADKVGEVPADKTIVQMIADAQTAATYDDTAITERIVAVEGDVATIKGDYLKAADKTALQDQITTNANAIERLTNGVSAEEIDGVNDLIQYVNDHGTEVTGMKEDIAANTKAISDQAAADEAKYETKTDAAAKLIEAKEYADGLNTDMAARVDVLEKIDHDAYVAADTKVLSDAKDYVDQKNDTMNERVEALEAIDHEHSNKALLDTYTQTEADLADAVAKKHEHTNATELAKIADGDVAKWNAIEQNAKDYADTKDEAIAAAQKAGDDAQADIDAFQESYATDKAALEKSISDNSEAIDTKANAADVYTKTETYTKSEVEALMTWGSF